MTEPPEEPFDEESLSRALRAPGSESELREEQKYAGMFRSARSSPAPAPVHLAPRRHRAVSRFGAGTAFVVVLAVGGSAAAAYTNHLPEPIQRFAHRALGPVAPPPPAPKHHATDVTARTDTSPTPTPSGTSTPSSTPSQSPSHSPSPSASAAHSQSAKPSPTPSATPSATPAPSATSTATTSTAPTPTPTEPSTPTPTPTLTPALPAALSISGSSHKADVGESVAFAGVVTSEGGDPVRRAKVALQTFSGHWSTLTTARTGSSGAVSLVLPPVSATTAVRLRTTNGVHSARWRVTLHPELSVTSSATDDNGGVVITVRASGAQPGDRVQLLTESGQVAAGALGSDGSVSFAVIPSSRRTRYFAQLPATSAHGADHASITVVVKKPGKVTGGP